MEVSWNRSPKSSILTCFPTINHVFWVTQFLPSFVRISSTGPAFGKRPRFNQGPTKPRAIQHDPTWPSLETLQREIWFVKLVNTSRHSGFIYIYVCVTSDVYSFTFLIYVKAVEESKSAHPSGDYFRASFVEPGQSTISKTARLKKVGNSHGWLKKGRIKDVGNLPSFTEITIINAYIILYIYDWHRLQPWITIGWFLFFTVDKSTSPDSDAIQAAVLWN